jgi:hypothetical protein
MLIEGCRGGVIGWWENEVRFLVVISKGERGQRMNEVKKGHKG